MASTEHDLQIAAAFLRAFGGPSASHVWQVYPEQRGPKVPGVAHEPLDPGEIIVGSLDAVGSRLVARNREGRGISVTIGESRNGGRTREDIIRQRALWLDFDRGLPGGFEPVPPSLLVRTPRGGHAYWLLHDGDGTDLDRWVRIQQALGGCFRAVRPESITDVAKAMRCPGFLHTKLEPTLVGLDVCEPELRYWASDIVEGYKLAVIERRAEPSRDASNVDLATRKKRCQRYVDACASLVQGTGHSWSTSNGMCGIGGDFGLEPDEYWPILQSWNDRGSPPLDEKKLQKKLDRVHALRRDPFGFRLTENRTPPEGLAREGVRPGVPWPEDDDRNGGSRKIYRSAQPDPELDKLDPSAGVSVGRRNVSREHESAPDSPWFEGLADEQPPPPDEWIEARDRPTSSRDHDVPPPDDREAPIVEPPPGAIAPDPPPPKPPDDGDDGGRRDGERRVLDRNAPLETAKKFAQYKFRWKAKYRTLVHHQRAWWVWNGRAYREVSREDLNARLYDYLAHALHTNDKGDLVDFNPDETRVGKIRHALEAVSHIDDERKPPCWTTPANRDDSQPAPHEIVACRNGLLHITTGDWLGRRPDFYTLTSLGVEYKADAKPPEQWLSFLDQLWPDDRESVQLLQEWFGLTLVPDTSFQKLLFVVGPRRSGKGTIARVMSELHGGEHNCAWLSMTDLVSRFGLHPLLDKSVAIMPDVRISPKLDQSEAVEKILRITGEDSLQVDRKNLPVIHGQIGARFMLMSNLPPRLSDAGAAFVSRVLALRMEESFLGKEDRQLKRKLIGELRGDKRVGGELEGILLWAIEGWKRLVERGAFVQPKTSMEIVEDMAELSTPVVGFVRSCCTMDDPNDYEHGDNLFDAWRSWCETEGREAVGEKSTFVRNLRAAFPRIVTRRNSVQVADTKKRVKVLVGIRLLNERELDERDREIEESGGRWRSRNGQLF